MTLPKRLREFGNAVSDRLPDTGDGSTDGSIDAVSRRGLLANAGRTVGAGALGAAALSSATPVGAAGTLCDWSRTDDGHLPWSTGGDYGGWGGHDHHGTDAGVSRTPTVFVHGNNGDACNFSTHADHLLDEGWQGDELWSITFREGTSSHADMREQLDDFVDGVLAETGAGQVNLVSHSLGVTGTRYWMEAEDRFDDVDVWVGLAGANHGVCVCPCCCDTTVFGDGTGEPCQFIGVQCFGVPAHPLYELNLPTETPGDVEYHTVRGFYDYFYYCNPTSPYLAGADNNLLYTDHMGTLESSSTREMLVDWLD